ncbi:D-alanine--D-alanine ligase family protein [Thermogemmatispora sp.]|uniref:D-alanine--D-alanine ligase family protein n=1 Tax=Thermogemmatispora sp. TaxID=1968838 RepID=UPI0035E3F846
MQHPQQGRHKLRVGVIFGGRSGEHEVSIASATSIIEHLDPNKYEVVPIAITQEGRWLLGAGPQHLLAAEREQTSGGLSESLAVTLPGDPTVGHLVPLSQPERPEQVATAGQLDVIFPVLHGTYGEDGTLQGLLEMAGVPYVGCGVLGSALGMDKEKMKMIFQAVGLPIVDYLVYRRHEWERDPVSIVAAIEARLGYPSFVKPANLGSSVGISKAHNRAELEQAIALAAEYDGKIIVERGIDCRELECAVLGNDEPLASVVGEIIPSNEFYDYRSKYIDNRSQIVIPADLPPESAELVRHYAVKAFLALDLSGLARVDFFLEKASGQLYVNEVNTMPGFTTISMYPKLWQASGLSYEQLLDRLIELALERHADRQRNRTRLQL